MWGKHRFPGFAGPFAGCEFGIDPLIFLEILQILRRTYRRVNERSSHRRLADLFEHHAVARCVELEIDVLIDDSPVNLERAADNGILGATLIHPWNADLIDGKSVIGADDWDGLRARLAPALSADAA